MTLADFSATWGVSKATLGNWLRKHKTEGPKGLEQGVLPGLRLKEASGLPVPLPGRQGQPGRHQERPESRSRTHRTAPPTQESEKAQTSTALRAGQARRAVAVGHHQLRAHPVQHAGLPDGFPR
jgi:hypothetical protein